ncbi:glycosyltransferase family 2 protein [Patescibacteria group bacterium]|nr:glycosyltransferase family 2 protein [Patescibacteria group bacterium]
MDKSYIDIAKATDIPNRKERTVYRFFEVLPGLISAGTLIGVSLFSWLMPSWVAVFIILFCFYYLFKIMFLAIHQVSSYVRMRRAIKTDWIKKIRKISRWKKIYHLIVLPTFKESRDVIEESLQALLASDYPKDKLIVILGMEEKAGQVVLKIAEGIKKKYKNKFFKFEITVHPKDVAGEISGKGSNSAFAVKVAKEQIIDKLKIPYKDILVSNFDIDTKVYPQYFSCLTYYYLTVDNPERASYQPIPVYNNNIWDAPSFSRVVATSNTFWQMVQQERSEKLTTYSTHTMPFSAWVEVGYPANVVSDDSRIFWRAYLHYDGNYRVVPLYYPVSMDAVVADNIIKTAINQYKQQRRWAWGCNEIPYLVNGFIKNKKIPLKDKISHLYTVVDGFWSWATAALLIFALGWLPIALGGSSFNITVLSYNLPKLTGNIMTFSLLGLVVSAILSTLMLPKKPEGVSWVKGPTLFLQWILLPFTLILFGTFPALDAQIRLMLGRYMGFWVTEKVRK